MKALLFADLDGTLIYSRRRITTPQEHLVPVAVGRDGKDAAWMTQRSAKLLEELRQTTLVIPTTTRGVEKYKRVRLPGPAPHLAIVGNGGTILRDGEVDLEWDVIVRGASRDYIDPVQLLGVLGKHVDESWVSAIGVSGLVLYIKVQSGAVIPAPLIYTVKDCGYEIFVEGNEAYAVQPHVTKEAAAQYLSESYPDAWRLACGDHPLDSGLLNWANFALAPRHASSQVTAPRTEQSGELAGEEILATFVGLTSAGPRMV